MNDDLKKLFVSLLGLSVDECEIIRKENISDEDMTFLLEASRSFDLTALLAKTLIDKGLLDKTDGCYGEFFNAELTAIYRYEKMNSAFLKLCETFEKEKIPFMPLKGAVLRQYYPEPWMRTSCDIDILIRSSDMNKAVEALQSDMGCHFDRKYLHDVSLFEPSNVHVELHYILVEDEVSPAISDILSSVWDDASLKEGYDYLYEMTDEMFLFYHVAHMYKHFVGGGCGIKPLVDLRIITKSMHADEEQLKKMLEKAGLYKFYSEMQNIVGAWFDNGERAELTEMTERYILSGGVYGTKMNRNTVSEAKGKRTKKNKLERFWSILILPRKNMTFLYPQLEKHPYLLPFYQVKRWFGVLKKEKRNKLKGDMTKKQYIPTEEEKLYVGDILKRLEIDNL